MTRRLQRLAASPILAAMLVLTVNLCQADPLRSLSADGHWAVFECETRWGTGLCLEDLTNGERRPLITLAGRNYQPRFSPDSLFIAFISEPPAQRKTAPIASSPTQVNPQTGLQFISVSDLIGHSWPVVAAQGIKQIHWSANAQWLLLAPQREDGSSDLYRITAGGTQGQWLTETPGISEYQAYYQDARTVCYQLLASDDEKYCLALPNSH